MLFATIITVYHFDRWMDAVQIIMKINEMTGFLAEQMTLLSVWINNFIPVTVVQPDPAVLYIDHG